MTEKQSIREEDRAGRRQARARHDRALPGVAREDIERLLALRHRDPHSILGAHPTANGVMVRAFRPNAESVAVLIDGEAPRAMSAYGNGLFDLLVRDRHEVFRYEIEVCYPGDQTYRMHQPYSFLPTLGDLDLHLWNEGSHERAWERLGAHPCEVDGVAGVAFAVWAPNAAGVSVVGNFNSWDGRLSMMRSLGSSGIWEMFIPDLGPGAIYKYEIRSPDGAVFLKTDPFARYAEVPPATASVVFRSDHRFDDREWMEQRSTRDPLRSPLSIYELHLGSWKRATAGHGRSLNYRELALELGSYVRDMGFTHVELMPVMEHPFSGSWGYQVTGYYAPTSRFGTPDDFRFMVDHLHQQGIGVILDWVPAHFPKDAFALGRFDGTALYEHQDPRQGEHPEWGTYIFNFGRSEVQSFLFSNANYWLGEMHADGLRVDAVSSMLYLDYGRRAGEFIPNDFGGNENLEAIAFLKSLNERIHGLHPGVLMIAEESTAWPGVSRPLYAGGLGFGFKWDMGWMHDTLDYFSKDPVYRRYHHNDLTFGLVYAWTENFVLPLSHDEVVYGKRALLAKMPGDDWQRFANLRALYGYQWARPGKKMLFMGGEFGQWNEWNHDAGLDWHLLDYQPHRGVQRLVRDLNMIYRTHPALHESDCDPAGFEWVNANDRDSNVIAFVRRGLSSSQRLLCVCNFSPAVRAGYRVGVSERGYYREILNTDAAVYGGSNQGNRGGVSTDDVGWNGCPYSLNLRLPPLGVVYFEYPE
ncbi:MAG: 1,4-alpha-glucan branching protein GlgB [Candidatus Binatus sp.]